jgi:hypothetical protein
MVTTTINVIPVLYVNNPETGYYTKTPQQFTKEVFKTMPFELRVEPTQMHEIKCRAKQIIRSRESGKLNRFKFFTGMIPLNRNNCFVGNHCRYSTTKGRFTELVIFIFSPDNSQLLCVYYPEFDKCNTREQVQFANAELPRLLGRFDFPLTKGLL